MLEFARRDLRWCLGNLQYVKLLDIPGLKAMSRFQLVWAILMFLGLPAWTLMIALLPVKVMGGCRPRRATLRHWSRRLSLCRCSSPCIFRRSWPGFARYPAQRRKVRLGAMVAELRFMRSASVIEIVFSFLQGAVSSFRTTLFMIGLAFGKVEDRLEWPGARCARAVASPTAFAGLWPHLVFGICRLRDFCALLSPTVLLWSLPLDSGLPACHSLRDDHGDACRSGGWLEKQPGFAAFRRISHPPAEIARQSRPRSKP